MNKTNRRAGVIIHVMAVMALLASCIGTGESMDEFKENGWTTELKWAVWDVATVPYYEALINAYEKTHPEIHIELVDLGSQDYMTALARQLSSGDTDLDLVCIKNIPGYMNLVNKKRLDQVEVEDLDLTVYGGVAEQLMFDEKLYALPFRNDFWLIYYNKDIFDAAEVPYPTNDMTFEDYDALARKVTETGLGKEVYGANYHIWPSTVQLFGILDGKHSVVDGDYEFLRPYYRTVLNQQRDGVVMDYTVLKTSSLHYSGIFAGGNVAMMNMGSWFISTLIDKIATGDYTEIANWGLVKYPHPEGITPGTTLGTITSLSVTAASEHPEESALFMAYVCGAEGAEIIASTGSFPAVKTEAVVAAISAIPGFPQDEQSIEALMTERTYLEMPMHEKSAEIEEILNEGHDSIMSGMMTIDEGIDYMTKEVGKIVR